jgi:hypothetical protein
VKTLELRAEYDPQSLRVREFGPRRTKFCNTVRLEPDIIAAFPDAAAVNQALRHLLGEAQRVR